MTKSDLKIVFSILFLNADISGIAKAKKVEFEMKQKIVLLEYYDNTEIIPDRLILGIFSKKYIKREIEYYKSLKGFSSNEGEFVCKEELTTDKTRFFLLQILDTSNESLELVKIFDNIIEAKKTKNKFFKLHNKNHYESYIDVYLLNERMWTEGFTKFE